jgi:hypothetical protein
MKHSPTLLTGCAFLLFGGTCLAAEPVPLIHAHAHNDYEHKRPLFDALEQGFCSVEADVWLVEGRLLVSHDRSSVKPERTLEALYLDPLRERVKRNGGHVHAGAVEFTLLIDVKSDAEPTYAALREVLKRHADMLTVFHRDSTEAKAVTVIVSGNRARQMMAAETERLAAYDGRLDDLDSGDSKHFIPLVSSNWTQSFKWRGTGEFPADEREKLRQIVAKAHQQGRCVRFWSTADSPAVWRELRAADVDLLNVDDLEGVRKFFVSESTRATK